MSVESISAWISPSNPELVKLLKLSEGMIMFPDPGFIPNSRRVLPKRSRVYDRVAAAVDKMFFDDFIAKGLAFVVPGSLVRSSGRFFHLNRVVLDI